MIRAASWAALFLALLGAGLVRAQAQAERRVVFLVRGAPADALGVEVLARIRGELRAARFEIDPAAPPEGGAAREVVEREARRPGVVAAMGIFFDAGDPEVWVAEARSGRTTVEPLADPAAGELRASVLAAKAVDLLKAALAEDQAGGAARATSARPVSSVAATAGPAAVNPSGDASPRDTLLMAGGGWLRAGGAGTLAPTLSLAFVTGLGHQTRGRLGGRVAIGGLGSSTEVASEAGSARVGQQLALVELLACWRSGWTPARAVLACASAGGGAQLLRIQGEGAPGFQGISHSLWAGTAAVGASLIWTPGRWLAIGVDARGVGAWPSTNVRIDGATAVRAGGPGVWLTASVGARL